MQLISKKRTYTPIVGISYNPLLAFRSISEENKKKPDKKDPIRPGPLIGPSGF